MKLAPEAHYRNNLGRILIELKRPAEAIDLLAALIKEQPEYPKPYYALATALDISGRAREAGSVLARLAELAIGVRNVAVTNQVLAFLMARPELPPEMARLGHYLRIAGDTKNAVAVFDRLCAAAPDDLGMVLARAVALLPMLSRDRAEQMAAREAYGQALADLAHRVEIADPAALVLASKQVGFAKPFFLSYSGEDDRELQSLYGRSISRMMQAALPEYATPLAPPPRDPDGRLRIGFASSYLGQHSVSKLLNGWIYHLDRKRFRVFVYNLTPDRAADDDWVQKVAEAADGGYRVGESETANWAKRIAGDRLHALIFPEIGMETMTVRLAALRLAPLQASACGHPVTSGLPTNDWFLTGDLVEPVGGEAHYTERLLRLPNLSIYYRPIPQTAGKMTRAEFGLEADDVIYICCQALYKYRPSEDDIPARIAEKVPNARFVFIGDPRAPASVLLRERLSQPFAARGLNAERHLRFVPQIPLLRFQAFLELGDVFLDSIAWSGGNTTLEAATVGISIVTLGGPFMRGHFTAGILKRLDLAEFIAGQVEDYVALAVRLGREPELRTAVCKRMAANRPRLYEDLSPIEALADFLEKTAAPTA